MDPICSIHDMDLRILAEKNKSGVEEEQSEKVDSVLVGPPYNLGKQ